jgi:hypothetical protein
MGYTVRSLSVLLAILFASSIVAGCKFESHANNPPAPPALIRPWTPEPKNPTNCLQNCENQYENAQNECQYIGGTHGAAGCRCEAREFDSFCRIVLCGHERYLMHECPNE